MHACIKACLHQCMHASMHAYTDNSMMRFDMFFKNQRTKPQVLSYAHYIYHILTLTYIYPSRRVREWNHGCYHKHITCIIYSHTHTYTSVVLNVGLTVRGSGGTLHACTGTCACALSHIYIHTCTSGVLNVGLTVRESDGTLHECTGTCLCT
jgi:hypothetical protein